jgi:uncharacterized membrane protein YhaH (DUF805 family)
MAAKLPLTKKCCTFAGRMRQSDFITNVLLVVLVAVLAAICIESVVNALNTENAREEQWQRQVPR